MTEVFVNHKDEYKTIEVQRKDGFIKDKLEMESLTYAQQKKLANIFAYTFKNHNKDGKVYFKEVEKWAGKQIQNAGFGHVTL